MHLILTYVVMSVHSFNPLCIISSNLSLSLPLYSLSSVLLRPRSVHMLTGWIPILSSRTIFGPRFQNPDRNNTYREQFRYNSEATTVLVACDYGSITLRFGRYKLNGASYIHQYPMSRWHIHLFTLLFTIKSIIHIVLFA